MTKPLTADEAREYVVAFTSDHADCIICPKSYLVDEGVTAFNSRKPYPIVRVFTADSSAEALAIGTRIFQESRESARPV